MARHDHAGEGAHRLAEARQMFEARDRFNFAPGFTCDEPATLLELARGALTFDSSDAPLLLGQRARRGPTRREC